MGFLSNKYEEFVSPKEELKSQSSEEGNYLTDILDGSLFTNELFLRQVPMIIMVFLLALFSIAIRNSIEESYRYKNKLALEVKELKYQSISISASLMYISKQSEVVRRISSLGLDLEESIEPPIRIVVKEEE